MSVRERDMLCRLKRFSNWTQVKIVIARCKGYVQRLCTRVKNIKHNHAISETPRNSAKNVEKQPQLSSICVEELQSAKTVVIQWMQRDAFSMEIKVLQEMRSTAISNSRQFAKIKKATMKKSSGIYTLDPFLHSDGTLRVGGRVKRANMSENVKNPVILQKNGHLPTFIIRHFNEKAQHSGRGITLNEVHANGYWTVNGNSAVRSFISSCVRFCYLRGTVGEQKMTDLRKSRLELSPPFSY